MGFKRNNGSTKVIYCREDRNSLMAKVCVVIVTYNRKDLLLNLLEKLTKQTHRVEEIIIVDNHSADGTFALLLSKGIIKEAVENEITESEWEGIRINYYLNSENTGGSGGFEKAFQLALGHNCDYIWAMDDDVEPENDCLEMLLNNIDVDSKVCIPSRNDENWTDELVIHYDLSNPFLFNIKQYKTVVNSNMVKEDTVIVEDFPLEGPLISIDVARSVGTPNSKYFIMYDDTDFAHRLSKYTSIKYVKNARLHRKLTVPKAKNSEWTWKEYYLLRNSFVFDKCYGSNIFVRRCRPLISCFAKIVSAICQRKLFRVKIICKAYNDAIHNRLGKRIEPGTDVRTL